MSVSGWSERKLDSGEQKFALIFRQLGGRRAESDTKEVASTKSLFPRDFEDVQAQLRENAA